MTWAKKNILGFSDDDILLDLERQRMEKAAAAEMENTSEVIKNTGIFTKVDKLYGAEADEEEVVDVEAGEDMDMDMETPDIDSGGEEEMPDDELMEDRTNYQDLMNTVGLDTDKKPTSKKTNLIKEELDTLKQNLDKLLE